MLQTLTIFFLLNSFCFCSPFKQDSSDQQKKFFNLFDSSNRTIDTSPPSPVYPALPSDFVKEIFTNRYHQTYVRIEVEKTRELIPRLLYGQAEVTQAQFEAVMSFNPSKVKNPDFPVSNVSMKDVSEYAAKISTSGEFYQVFDRENWLKALLVNQSTSYHFGNNPDLLGDYAWYGFNSFQETHVIRSLRSNLIGLYDMHGNVAELVQYNQGAEVINCSNFDAYGHCASNYYYDVRDDFKSDHVGFRLMLTLYSDSEQPPEQEDAKIVTSIAAGDYQVPFLLEISANVTPYHLVYTVDNSPALPANGLLCDSSRPCSLSIAKDRIIRARLCKGSNPYDCPYKEFQFHFTLSQPLPKPEFQSSSLAGSQFRLAWDINTIDFTFLNFPSETQEYEIKTYLEIQGFANSPYLVENGGVNLEKRQRPFCRYEDLAQFREIKTRRSAHIFYTMKARGVSMYNNSSLRKNRYAGLIKKFYIYTSGIGQSSKCTLQNIGKIVNFNEETSLEVE